MVGVLLAQVHFKGVLWTREMSSPQLKRNKGEQFDARCNRKLLQTGPPTSERLESEMDTLVFCTATASRLERLLQHR
jgi:hypothetical protein